MDSYLDGTVGATRSDQSQVRAVSNCGNLGPRSVRYPSDQGTICGLSLRPYERRRDDRATEQIKWAIVEMVVFFKQARHGCQPWVISHGRTDEGRPRGRVNVFVVD